mgnify:CR=1 FL=1
MGVLFYFKGEIMAFTHLHLHTDYSLLDGLGKIEDYVNKAKELGQTALAITDHGVGYGLVEFYNKCKAADIKPILGCEAYVAPSSRFIKNKVDGHKYYHLILLVKNEIGYKNLCKLITRSNTEGFYFKPRIDFELLSELHEGLICLSGCVAGEVSQAILEDNYDRAKEVVKRYKELFKDDYYLEIQNHGLNDEIKAFSEIIKIARTNNIPLVCTNDCHYVDTRDAEAHEWLLCLQTGKTISDPDRMIYKGDYSLKSEEEMRKLYPAFQDAFDNTEIVANKCNFDFTFAHKPADYRMPKVDIPKEFGDDYFGYLKHLAFEGLEKRYPKGHNERQQAVKNLNYELDEVIGPMGFAKYFLDTLKTIDWSRKNGILVGPGRGSGAGSTVNYCIGITDIDPIKYRLLFERFLNPERISMPDIDVDYCYTHKDKVIASEVESNGKDKFSKIQAFMTMQAKGVLRDMTRVAGLPPSVGNDLAKLIPDKMSLEEAFEAEPEIKNYIESSENKEKLEKIWQIALKIENVKKSSSTHACGHIPTPVPCEELYPCSVDDETGYLVCQYDMVEAEHLGNLKKDLLMLRNLAVIEFAHKEINKNGIEVPLWTDEILNNKETLEMIAKGDTKGVFQLESDGMSNFMKELKPDCFEDVIAGVSLYRPGPMDYIPKYVAGKHDKSTITYLTPELEHILKPTYGVIVYQEQVMQIVRDLAGFSMGRADVVRKAMGKKKQDIMDAESINFIYGSKELGITGCINNGISESIAKEIWAQMAEFAKYAFNKSHAAAYAAISMQTAYLKCHYKVPFMTGLLTSVMDKTDKLAAYVFNAKASDIAVLPPDVNKSEVGFSIDEGSIRFGLNAIKNVGESVANELVKNRKGAYKSIDDVLEKNNLSSSTIESLIKAGAFDFTKYNRKTLMEGYKDLRKYLKDKKKTQVEGQIDLFSFLGEEKELANYQFDIKPEYSNQKLLELEKEVTGIYMSGHPLDDYVKYLSEKCTISAMALNPEEDDSNADIKEGMNVVYGGIITEVRKIYTKKNDQMAFIKVEGIDGTIPCVVFPKQFSIYKEKIKENTKILLQGKVSLSDDKDNSILIDTIEDLESSNKTLWLRFKDIEEYNAKIDTIEKIISSNDGNERVIYFISDSKQKKIRKAGCDINPIIEQLYIILGKDNVVISSK